MMRCKRNHRWNFEGEIKIEIFTHSLTELFREFWHLGHGSLVNLLVLLLQYLLQLGKVILSNRHVPELLGYGNAKGPVELRHLARKRCRHISPFDKVCQCVICFISRIRLLGQLPDQRHLLRYSGKAFWDWNDDILPVYGECFRFG